MPTPIKYLIIYTLSGLKIIFGPTLGMAYGFNVVETALISWLGMMTTVYILSYFGTEIRTLTVRVFGKKKQKKKVFTPRKRRFVKIWKTYGVMGIAFLTPVLLSPPGGTILANAFGGKREDIIRWMWIFGGFWSFTLTLLVKYASWFLKDIGII
jgi:uncharacterized membrane protein